MITGNARFRVHKSILVAAGIAAGFAIAGPAYAATGDAAADQHAAITDGKFDLGSLDAAGGQQLVAKAVVTIPAPSAEPRPLGLASTETPAKDATASVYGPADEPDTAPIISAKQHGSASKTGWSSTLTATSVAFVGLRTVDVLQTMKCLDRTNCEETNPLLGSHPSKGALVALAVGSTVALLALTKLFAKSDRGFAKIFLMLLTAGQAAVVYHNNRVLN